MNALEKMLASASQKYYTDGSSGMSDAKFDSLMNQLKAEKPDSPILTSVGHGYDVNLDTTPGEKVPHRYGNIGSLTKCHNWSEVPKLIQAYKDEMYASLKLDGLSIVLYYSEGRMFQALTRGKDNIGIDITDKALKILGTDRLLEDTEFTGSVRGEILMSNKNFETFLEVHPDATNSRNSAAGLINGKEITDDFALLDIVVYRVIGDVLHRVKTPTYSAMMDWLNANFNNVVVYCPQPLSESTIDADMDHLRSQWYGNFPADGIVLTRETLKYMEDDAYEFDSVAYKFQAEIKEAEVEGVEWSYSKMGYMIPRVRIKPVELSGATVRYVTGFNAKYILDNKIGSDAVVSICRSGEVIPDIQDIIRTGVVDIPSECPDCHMPLSWKGVHIACTNSGCSQAGLQNVLIWMNCIAPTDGLGDVLKVKFLTEKFGYNVTLDAIYKHGPITTTSSLVQEQKFIDMFNSLFVKQIPLKEAIQACNIPRFGDVTSAKLAQYPDFVKHLMLGIADEHESILGTADTRALFDNIDKIRQLNYVADQIIWEAEKPKEMIKVAITGKLSISRSAFEKELESFGYKAGNIGKDTAYLITDDPTGSSSKNKYADEHHIEKITEADFRKRFMA